MKRFIFIFSVALLFVSCGQSPEDKANALIKAELRKTLFKPDTYKPIETKLDSAFAPFDDPNLYKIMGDLAKMAAELEGLDYQLRTQNLRCHYGVVLICQLMAEMNTMRQK